LADAGLIRYNDLNSWAAVQSLLDNGETEGLHLEAKAPSMPRVNRDQQIYIAKAISGFSNTAGGIVIWGVSITKHEHSGLDVLTQIEPVANCHQFMRSLQRIIPTLSTPPILSAKCKCILRRKSDTRGVVVTHFPYQEGSPVQSSLDNLFYWRSGDDFHPAPYEMIRRLFLSADSPDLRTQIDADLAKKEPDGTWVIPLVIANNSQAIAEHTNISVEITNRADCEAVTSFELSDASGFNKGRCIYMKEVAGVIHKGLNLAVGSMRVKMKVDRLPKRKLLLAATLYANRMRARKVDFNIHFTSKGFRLIKTESSFLDQS